MCGQFYAPSSDVSGGTVFSEETVDRSLDPYVMMVSFAMFVTVILFVAVRSEVYGGTAKICRQGVLGVTDAYSVADKPALEAEVSDII